MTRIKFENSPSTNTPINANNLNKLNNVVISETEPTTGEEVWIQKGKNYINFGESETSNLGATIKFDKSKIIFNGTGTAGNLIGGSSYTASKYICELPAGTYTYSINISGEVNYENNGTWATFLRTPSIMLASIGRNDSVLVKTFTLTETTKIAFNIYSNNTAVFNNYTLSLQIEKNSSATSYEDYIDKKIHTKNDNGVYEEFLNVDKIIESGSTENGNYVKYSDGTMICYGTTTKTVSSGDTASNGVYYAYNNFTFPVNFISKPTGIGSVSQSSGIYFSGLGNGQPTTSGIQVRALMMQKFTDISITFNYFVIGKWK